MHFHAEHTFDGPSGVVAAVLTDPEFYQGLTLPDLSRPEVLQSGSEGASSVLRLRYEFVGTLDPIALHLLGESRLAWIQEVQVEGSGESGELTFAAALDPNRLRGSARFTLEDTGGGCIRRLSGDLTVAVPLIGPKAEKRIVPGILRRLDIEAEAINHSLV